VFLYSGPDSASRYVGYVDYVKIGKIEKLYLANLEPVSEDGWEKLGVGIYPFSDGPALEGNILRPKHGKEFPYGLLAHAPSVMEYSLPENAVTFSSSIYLDGYDGCYSNGAIFIVELDDQEIYRSSPIDYNDTVDPIDVSVSVKDGQMLKLITDPIEDDANCDWSVWGDPYLILR
jgi:NPCBM/NEW2 domain-containing protein